MLNLISIHRSIDRLFDLNKVKAVDYVCAKRLHFIKLQYTILLVLNTCCVIIIITNTLTSNKTTTLKQPNLFACLFGLCSSLILSSPIKLTDPTCSAK